MAYDSVRGATVLFGGRMNCCGDGGDTWVWDGINWTQRTPATAPSGRYGSAMAYDNIRGVTVLFGGYYQFMYGDTWEWQDRTANVTEQPADQTVCAGKAATFTVTATGGTLTYQWRKNGININDGPTGNGSTYIGATTATLTVTTATTEDSGNFDVVIGGPCMSPIISDAAACTVFSVAADFNQNGVVNAADLTIFVACAMGPAIPYHPAALPPGCTLSPDDTSHIAADFDKDDDVDSDDFAAFQRYWSGDLPADPNCQDTNPSSTLAQP
jgi:hypothetical protein